MLILFFITPNVYAGNAVNARIGNLYFDTLEEAIEAANSNDIINLTSNISLNKTLNITKNVNINLNNYNIESKEKVFLIQGGSLNLSGNGTIKETSPYYGAIMLKGSDDPSKTDYSTVSIESGINLEGWSGIFIDHDNNTGYGILVNMNGNINAVNDINGDPGVGIYVNGNIKHQNNSPIINLGNEANITSTGTGIYAAGFATYNINGATIEGVESGLGIKSGIFNIINGTIKGTGEDKTPTNGNNNGINASGGAIQIESNPNYAGNIELNIQDGNFESKNSNVIYEYIVNNTTTKVKNISIENGKFISRANKNVFSLSDSFKDVHQNFISGGTYSSNPSDYLNNNYSINQTTESLYEVVNNNHNNGIHILNIGEENKKSFSKIPIIIITIIILGLTIYLNRKRISILIRNHSN